MAARSSSSKFFSVHGEDASPPCALGGLQQKEPQFGVFFFGCFFSVLFRWVFFFSVCSSFPSFFHDRCCENKEWFGEFLTSEGSCI